jgi:hypothetical protein
VKRLHKHISTAGLLLAFGATSAPVAAQEESSPPTINDISLDDRDFLFLVLGERRDYLQAERWRIVDQIEQAIPALYEPRLPLHGYTLPPGARRLGLNFQFARNPGDFGTDEFYELFFDDVAIDFVKANLDFLYGFEVGPLKDLVVRVNVPYKFLRHDGTGHPFRIDPMLMTMNGSGEGLGDISITFKKKWLDQGNGPFNLATMLGGIFPTAQDGQEFDASQTIFIGGDPAMAVSAELPGNPAIDIFGRTPTDRLFPRVAQPGNGSWGARFGFGLTRQFERSAVHGGAVFDLLADNDGITPGNELRYAASYVVPPFSSDHVTLDLGVIGRWKGAESFPGEIMHPERDPATGGPMMDVDGNMMMFLTPRPDFEHGNVTLLSASLVLVTNPNLRIFASPAIRVVEPERGPSPRWTFTVGQTVTF